MPKTTSKTSTPRLELTRTVYDVTTTRGSRRVEATDISELKELLARLLPDLEPYALQAVARLASVERATVTASGWSVKRVGVMQFQPDDLGQRESKTGSRLPSKPEVTKDAKPPAESQAYQFGEANQAASLSDGSSLLPDLDTQGRLLVIQQLRELSAPLPDTDTFLRERAVDFREHQVEDRPKPESAP